jgi:hypothetical protein
MRIVTLTIFKTTEVFDDVKNLSMKHDENGNIEAEFDFLLNKGDKELQHCKLSNTECIYVQTK